MVDPGRSDSLPRGPRGVIAARLLLIAALLAAAYFAGTRFLSASSVPSSRPLASSPSAAALAAPGSEKTASEAPTMQMGNEPTTPRAGPAQGPAVRVAPPLPEAVGTAEIAPSQPIQLLVDAPVRVVNGSAFEVSVGVPSGRGIYSARFRVHYDDDALEVLDIIDATGAPVAGSMPERGMVDFDLDAGRGARQAPAIRFLARTSGVREIRFSVEAFLRDRDNLELPVAPTAPRSIVVEP